MERPRDPKQLEARGEEEAAPDTDVDATAAAVAAVSSDEESERVEGGDLEMQRTLARRRSEFAGQIGDKSVDLAAVASLPAAEHKSMGCLLLTHPLRAASIRIYTDNRFTMIILAIILLNSLLMLVTYSYPCENRPCLQDVAYWIDLFFTTAFTIEMLVKVTALGLVMHEQAYLRSGWNMLDCCTVLASLVSLSGFASNVSILRLLRILRPLRTMSKVAGLRNLMGALFAAVPEIRDNVILIIFIVIIFAILGIQLFSGVTHRRCYADPSPALLANLTAGWAATIDAGGELDPFSFDDGGFSGNLSELPTFPHLLPTSATACGGSFTCGGLSYEAIAPFPHDAVVCRLDKGQFEDAPLNFDNLGVAVLLVFKIFSGDDWPEDMVNVMNASSPHAWVFFFMCIMVGNLFATNLFLAVLINAYYTHAKTAHEPEEAQIRAKAIWLRITPDRSHNAGVNMLGISKAGSSSHLRTSLRRGSVAAGLHVMDELMRSDSEATASGEHHAAAASCDVNVGFGAGASGAGGGERSSDSVAVSSSPHPKDATDDQQCCQRAASSSLAKEDVSGGDGGGGGGGGGGPNGRSASDPTATANDVTALPNRIHDESAAASGGAAQAESRRSSAQLHQQRGSKTTAQLCKGLRATAHLPPPTTAFTSPDDGLGGGGGSADGNHNRPPGAANSNNNNGGDEHRGPRRVTLAGMPDDEPKAAVRDGSGSGAALVDDAADEEEAGDGAAAAQGCPAALRRVRRVAERLVLHRYCERFILGVTALNVLALAVDYHGIDDIPAFAKTLDIVSLVCTVIFAVEISVKLFGMGPVTCLRDKYNAFDAFLVLISLPDLFTGGSSAFSAFRAFRVVRAVRILRRWPSVHNLVTALIGCLNEGMYVAILLLLQIFIFSILGMQLFEGKFHNDFRMNYDSMWEAALTCFVVITGDAWAKVMKAGMSATNEAASLYFLILYVVGNFVLVNVVVAVILDKLDDNIADDSELEEASMQSVQPDVLPDPGAIAARLQLELPPASPGGKLDAAVAADNVEDGLEGSNREMSERRGSEQPTVEIGGPALGSAVYPPRRRKSSWLDDVPTGGHGRPCYVYPHLLVHTSLGLFTPQNRVRVLLARVLHSVAFDWFIVGAISVNLAFLALEGVDNSDGLQQTLNAANYFFTALFFLEMLLKIFVLGLLMPAPPYDHNEVKPYLRDPWNRVDCIVVILAMVGLVYPPMSAFRSLRTLRLVIRSSSLRLVIAAMLSTLPSITQGLVVCAFVWFVFGILGTQLFKGTFHSCNDPAIDYQIECEGNYTKQVQGSLGFVSENATRRWVREHENFDNVFSAMYTLFAVAVGEGWANVMYRGIDATSAGRGPEKNHFPAASLFFVIFHVVGNFFCLNLIIGILINNFTENRKSMSSINKMTERQKKYLETEATFYKKFLILKEPAPTSPAYRRVLYQVACHLWFERLVTCVIIVNMIILATQHHDQTAGWGRMQDIGNNICTCVFVVEAVIKLVGLSPRLYFGSNWNRFDFFIVLPSVGGMIATWGGLQLQFIRVLPTGRLFRLVHLAKGLEKLFNTMFEGHNVAYFANVGVLCVACFFMFGVAGVSMFGNLERTEGLDHNMNFENVASAMLTLYAMSTTEGWLDVRNGVTNRDDCGGPGQGGCGSKYANFYIVSFIVVGAFMMLNLFAAVVVELFEAQEAQDLRAGEIQAMQTLKERWERLFGERTRVSCREFIAALYPRSDREGLIPSRLYRVPRLPRPEDDMEEANVCMISLTNSPPNHVLCAYLLALSLPVEVDPNGGEPCVHYHDVIAVMLAKVFCMQETDMNHLAARGFVRSYPRTALRPGMRIGHWFAMVLVTGRKWYKDLEDVPVQHTARPTSPRSSSTEDDVTGSGSCP